MQLTVITKADVSGNARRPRKNYTELIGEILQKCQIVVVATARINEREPDERSTYLRLRYEKKRP